MPDEKKENNNEAPLEVAAAPEKKDELAETKDRLLRLAAEFDNYKKRTAKETEMAKLIGKAEAIRKLLPVLDEFELAMAALKSDGETDKGLGLVFSNFVHTLKKEGLTEMDCKGAADPYKHEVMLMKNSKEKEGTIVEVVRKGYELNGIMLRPVSVIVSNGKGIEENKTEKENKNE